MRLRLSPWPLLLAAALLPLLTIGRVFAGDDDGSAPWPDGSSGEVLKLPGMPPMRLPPGVHIFGSDGHELHFGPAQGLGQQPYDDGSLAPHHQLPQQPPLESAAMRAAKAKAARVEALKRAMAPQPTHAALRAEALDSLFKRLASAHDADEADGIATAIEHVWSQSDSDTATLLMDRALAAQQGGHLPLALALLDKVVSLEPDWAEAWNKRAGTRLLGGDLTGAADDLQHVLKLEPRQFSALVALGFVLEKQGFDKRALDAFQKALALNPQQPELQSIIEKLRTQIEGRDI
ncbi:MAG: tetratricopeptide repeat protein [Pseudomonadota bacterium]